VSLKDRFDEEEVNRLEDKFNTYKSPILEYIFLDKYRQSSNREILKFTYDDVSTAARTIGHGLHLKRNGEERINWANFVKDLIRGGNHSPRSESAVEKGYILRPGNKDSDWAGEFVSEDKINYDLSIECPNDLTSTEVDLEIYNDLAEETIALIGSDEGGLLSIMQHAKILSYFFDIDDRYVSRVQVPVKKQPEIDGLYIATVSDGTFLIPCEAKGSGSDKINNHQIYNSVVSSFSVLEETEEVDLFNQGKSAREVIDGVKPLGAKILPNGDIHIARFADTTTDNLSDLESHIKANGVLEHARFSLNPTPPKW
jgi:hypothetical protein